MQARVLIAAAIGASSTPLVVIARSSMPRFRREPLDQHREVLAQQWFAAGEPHLARTPIEKHVDQPLDFLEVEDVLARQPRVVLLRHAVLAAQVATVGYRQAQVGEGPVKGITNDHVSGLWHPTGPRASRSGRRLGDARRRPARRAQGGRSPVACGRAGPHFPRERSERGLELRSREASEHPEPGAVVGRKGADAICPPKVGSHRPATADAHDGQRPSAVM